MISELHLALWTWPVTPRSEAPTVVDQHARIQMLYFDAAWPEAQITLMSWPVAYES